jgi:DNA-binding NarL/FixJ family response regulator
VTGAARLRVFVVDDHALVRSGIRAELGDAVEVVGEADEAGAAVELILERTPDVVLLDVHLPGGGGRAVLEQVLPAAPAVAFLALSMSDAAEDVIDVIRAGARGYVTKHISGPDLVDAIHRIADGDAVFSPRLAGFVLDAFADPAHGPSPAPSFDPELDQLTPRERQVLRLIARGYAYKEIGRDLGISTRTVETHVSAVLRKLQLANRYQLSTWAAERRMV